MSRRKWAGQHIVRDSPPPSMPVPDPPPPAGGTREVIIEHAIAMSGGDDSRRIQELLDGGGQLSDLEPGRYVLRSMVRLTGPLTLSPGVFLRGDPREGTTIIEVTKPSSTPG